MEQTLLDIDIIREADENELLDPFDKTKVKGASYDIRAGAKAVVATPDGHDWIALDEQKTIEICPGRTCIIYSLEKINMPADMKGRLSLRSHFAIQRLEYSSGIIDPGYRGYLFLTVANLGDSPVEIKYGEPLVTAEFVRLSKPASILYNEGREILSIKDRKLELPLPKRLPYEPAELSERVDALKTLINELDARIDEFRPILDFTQRLVDSLILASIAGVLAGVVMVFLPQIQGPWDIVIAAVAIALGIAGFVARRRL